LPQTLNAAYVTARNTLGIGFMATWLAASALIGFWIGLRYPVHLYVFWCIVIVAMVFSSSLGLPPVRIATRMVGSLVALQFGYATAFSLCIAIELIRGPVSTSVRRPPLG
jgi:hypothetical protein